MCLGNRLEDFPEKAYCSRQLPLRNPVIIEVFTFLRLKKK